MQVYGISRALAEDTPQAFTKPSLYIIVFGYCVSINMVVKINFCRRFRHIKIILLPLTVTYSTDSITCITMVYCQYNIKRLVHIRILGTSHWKWNVVILMTFSPLAPEVVKISSAANGETFVKMTTFSFQWLRCYIFLSAALRAEKCNSATGSDLNWTNPDINRT